MFSKQANSSGHGQRGRRHRWRANNNYKKQAEWRSRHEGIDIAGELKYILYNFFQSSVEQATTVIATRGPRPHARYHNESSRAKRPVDATAAQPAGDGHCGGFFRAGRATTASTRTGDAGARLGENPGRSESARSMEHHLKRWESG